MNNVFTEPFGQPNIIYKLYCYNKQFLKDWVQLWSENRKKREEKEAVVWWCRGQELGFLLLLATMILCPLQPTG